MRNRNKKPVLEYDNQADPAAQVVISIRHALGGLVTQCTWQCRGCLERDDQGQALKWAQADASDHAARCHVRPLGIREL